MDFLQWQKDFKTIAEYHGIFSHDVREKMQQIRKVVKGVAPEAKEVISYQIPAFKIGKKYLIYYSAYTKHISLSSPWSEAFRKKFASELKGLTVTKSAIQLPNKDELPLDLIKRIVAFRKWEIDQEQ
ncbi:iron chaperone [Parapedobacter deserti]|uniref:Iron chaperone n=1 Tax=Parapedobacter deserti TaxID=1912957 RepID=A0ABV7JST1_9SPHI